MKLIKKKRFSFLAFTIMGFLVVEIGAFGIYNYVQPSYKEVITTKVQHSQAPTGGYYVAINNRFISLDSTYAALNINKILNATSNQNDTNLVTYIMSQYDNTTGLFYDHEVPSLPATYSAIQSLYLLDKLSLINKTKTIASVLALKTTNSLFRDYIELNQTPVGSSGELDHLFQAVSILQLLNNNPNNLYSTLNRTQVMKSLLTFQYQGGFKDQVTDTAPNMQNAYYVSKIISNLGISLKTFESNGFNSTLLFNWIKQMYSGSGFMLNQNSVASVEASAYAIITLTWLGYTPSTINKQFGNSFQFMLEALGTSYINEHNSGTLDSISDVLVSFQSVNSIESLNQPYLNPSGQTDFMLLIGLTSVLLIIFIILTIVQVFKEDESNYFETALKMCLKEVYETKGTDLQRLSYLLGEQIKEINFVFQDYDQSIANLRAKSEDYEFIILFEADSWFPKELTKYDIETRQALVGIDFLGRAVLYTIDEALEVLKT